MSIKVGINENVQLNKAEINDKGTLVVSFNQGQELSQVDTNDLINSAAGIKPRGATNVMVWGVQAESNGEPRTVEYISRDLGNLRDQLEHLLEGYMTRDNAKLDPYVGLGLTGENFASRVLQQGTLDAIYKNLTSQFVNKVQTLGEGLEKKFRLLLVRKSASNHYGTFRKNYIGDNPFWESMDIPAEASKVKFTKYEKDKGLDNSDSVSRDQAADRTEEPQSTADGILGVR
jgi:hypothetical protein